MINLPEDKEIEDIVNNLDNVLEKHISSVGPNNLCSILLSRVVLLSQHEPAFGKDLIRYVWEQLDKIEQERPSGGSYDF